MRRLAIFLLLAAGCVVDTDDDWTEDNPSDSVDDDGIGDTGDDGADVTELPAQTPAALVIGFNTGYATQFAFFPDFFNISPGPRRCHAYFSWQVAYQAPHTGAVTDHASRAFVDDWFANAAGKCDEVLVSFKSMTPGSVPSTSTYAAAFQRFLDQDWATETGFTGAIIYAPWNEPNNGDTAGNGLGAPIPPRVAARYYLVAERACRIRGCTVVAGDFASNGNMWDDFRWNCANDNVAPSQLCKTKSSLNHDNRGPSYLDVYKNEIANRATELGLPQGFRPRYFAYHGWHDSNSYLAKLDHCSSYETCTLRRVLRNLGGSWSGVEIWNTEDGIGQFSTNAPDDRLQACGAAFLQRLMNLSARVKRLYITRLHGGPGQLLLADHTPRPALDVLANRRTTYAAGNCR